MRYSVQTITNVNIEWEQDFREDLPMNTKRQVEDLAAMFAHVEITGGDQSGRGVVFYYHEDNGDLKMMVDDSLSHWPDWPGGERWLFTFIMTSHDTHVRQGVWK